MKYGDLPEGKQQELDSIIESADESSIENRAKREVYEGFGLCGSCTNFCVCETEFEIVQARCSSYIFKKMPLNSSKPILKCTEYAKRGEMSLFDAKQMAIIIEPKNKVGFEVDN